MESDKISELQEELNILQCKLDNIKNQICSEYVNCPYNLDVYCQMVKMTDKYIYVVMGKDDDSFTSKQDLEIISKRLGKAFVGISCIIHGVDNLYIEKGQYILIFDNKC